MSLVTSRLRQKMVQWPQGSNAPDNYGQPTVGDPVELDCRWVVVTDEFIDASGTKQTSSATIYTAAALAIGDLVRLGTLASLASPTVPKDNTGVWEVRNSKSNPDFRNNETSHTAQL